MSADSDWSFVISGGGSGGHLFPALAVLEEVRQRSNPPSSVLVLASQRKIDQAILKAENVDVIPLATPDSRSFLRRPMKSWRAIRKSIAVAADALRSVPRPIVMGTGGFGSLPGIWAARRIGTPIVLLEQNVVPGRATSLVARQADVLCVSFEASADFLSRKTVMHVTGNPVRRSIAALAATPPQSRPQSQTLLILGGSQGAQRLNQSLVEIANKNPQLFAGWKIVHQTGVSDVRRVQQAYAAHSLDANVSKFFSDLPEILSDAALVISRAGATSLAEFACAGVPAILVPYPKSIRDHQVHNARWYSESGAAEVVEETNSNAASFSSRLLHVCEALMSDAHRRSAMATAMHALAEPHAAARVADFVQNLI